MRKRQEGNEAQKATREGGEPLYKKKCNSPKIIPKPKINNTRNPCRHAPQQPKPDRNKAAILVARKAERSELCIALSGY